MRDLQVCRRILVPSDGSDAGRVVSVFAGDRVRQFDSRLWIHRMDRPFESAASRDRDGHASGSRRLPSMPQGVMDRVGCAVLVGVGDRRQGSH
jgi:hypothetical protein